jgi:hypothetical protein
MLADPINATIEPNCGTTIVVRFTDLGKLGGRQMSFGSIRRPLRKIALKFEKCAANDHPGNSQTIGLRFLLN